MKEKILVKHNLVSGIVAGLIAGILFGIILARMGVLTYAGRFFTITDPLSAFIVHLIFSGILGVIFSLVFCHAVTNFFSGSLWGIVYGLIWWFIGPLILCPWVNGMSFGWNSAEMCNAFPMLIGHLVFGLSLGVTYYWWKYRK
jgi:uncharacterized membrane protein YagU involved in acid resistance